MKNASILARIGGLAIAITLAVQAISVTVVLLTPPPGLARMSPALVLAAVRNPQVSNALGWRRVESKDAPFETSTGTGHIVASGLAKALELPSERVQVRMIAAAQPGETAGAVTSIVRTGQSGDRSATKLRPLGAAQTDTLAASVVMTPGFSLPAFQTAVLLSNGLWLVVEPPSGAFLRWVIRLSVTLALSLLLITPLVWWAARRLTLPVRALAQAARSADLAGLSQARQINGPPEVIAVAEALEDMRSRLTSQVEQRMRILAAVAHDLRTPLTSLRLRAETAPSVERDRMATDISRMEAMIADVLAFSAAGLSRGERRRMDVTSACREVLADPAFHGHVTLSQGPSAFIDADTDRVRRVLSNLFDNAVRYAGAAEIRLEVTGNSVAIVVADRGAGISKDHLEQVFEPFFRLESSRSRLTGGAGLGLAICRELASLDAGVVNLQPRSGGGLEARVTYPTRVD